MKTQLDDAHRAMSRDPGAERDLRNAISYEESDQRSLTVECIRHRAKKQGRSQLFQFSSSSKFTVGDNLPVSTDLGGKDE